MAIVKAVIGSFAFNIGYPIQVGVAFFDADGNTIDVQTFPLPVAPYASRPQVLNAIGAQAIAYAAQQGATITNGDILSVY